MIISLWTWGSKDKACIVTGASRGIGRATAAMLADEGAHVLSVSRSSDDLALDVTGPDAGERVVAECVERFGRVDVLVNNAGTSRVLPARRAERRRLAGAVGAARDGPDAPHARRRAAHGGGAAAAGS